MKLALNDLRVMCVIGDLPHERETPQEILVNVELTLDDASVATSDDLADGVDYATLSEKIREALVCEKCRLIERAAKVVSSVCFREKKVAHAKVSITKSGAIANLASASATLENSREEWNRENSGDATPVFPEYELSGIETIARGVWIADGQILLCRAKGSRTTYLPGGHIEFGETGRVALAREMQEEAGVSATIGKFLGCSENQFLQHGKPHAEINLVYEMSCATTEIFAKEAHIEFVWWPINDLEGAQLLPADFRALPNFPNP